MSAAAQADDNRQLGELAALIERLTSNQAIALGTLRAGLPDKVASSPRRSSTAHAERHRPHRRRTSSTAEAAGVALLDYDSKGMPDAVASHDQAPRRLLAGAADGVAGPGDVGQVTRLVDQRRTVARRHRELCPARTACTSISRVKDGSRRRALPADAARPLLAGRFRLDDGRRRRRSCWSARSSTGWSARPERLVFEGGPVLVPPLQQDKESRRPIAVDGRGARHGRRRARR